MVVWNEKILVATFDAIHCLDFSLRHLGKISNERFCDIHEFQVTDEGIVAASTRMDAVVWCDWRGNVNRVWRATEDPLLAERDLGVPHIPRKTNSDWRALYPADNPTHLNCVSFLGPDVLVALHNQGLLWNIDSGRIHHDARPFGASKTHNHQRLQDGSIVLNDTRSGKFLRFLAGSTTCIDVSAPGVCANRPRGLSSPWAVDHGWLRGFSLFDEHRVILGQCPASLVTLNTETKRIERVLRLSDDWRVSVNGLALF